MKPKYTATDLFRIKKPLKLLSLIEGMPEYTVDVAFKEMSLFSSRDIYGLLLTHFKDFTKKVLPGITRYRIRIIARNYRQKLETRAKLKRELFHLKLNNRLLPLPTEKYIAFSEKSRNNFITLTNIFSEHKYGKERISYGSAIREVK